MYDSWNILIRIPYRSAADCDATYHALESETTSITNWNCIENGGFIYLWFNTSLWTEGYDINPVLSSRYPMVAGGFNGPVDCWNAVGHR